MMKSQMPRPGKQPSSVALARPPSQLSSVALQTRSQSSVAARKAYFAKYKSSPPAPQPKLATPPLSKAAPSIETPSPVLMKRPAADPEADGKRQRVHFAEPIATTTIFNPTGVLGKAGVAAVRPPTLFDDVQPPTSARGAKPLATKSAHGVRPPTAIAGVGPAAAIAAVRPPAATAVGVRPPIALAGVRPPTATAAAMPPPAAHVMPKATVNHVARPVPKQQQQQQPQGACPMAAHAAPPNGACPMADHAEAPKRLGGFITPPHGRGHSANHEDPDQWVASLMHEMPDLAETRSCNGSDCSSPDDVDKLRQGVEQFATMTGKEPLEMLLNILNDSLLRSTTFAGVSDQTFEAVREQLLLGGGAVDDLEEAGAAEGRLDGDDTGEAPGHMGAPAVMDLSIFGHGETQAGEHGETQPGGPVYIAESQDAAEADTQPGSPHAADEGITGEDGEDGEGWGDWAMDEALESAANDAATEAEHGRANALWQAAASVDAAASSAAEDVALQAIAVEEAGGEKAGEEVVGAEGEEELPSELTSEQSQLAMTPEQRRAFYMRFLRKFATKRMQRKYPELVERFRDEGQRKSLWNDFFSCSEEINHVNLLHFRRMIQKQKSEMVLRPHTHDGLMIKYNHDAAYVALVVKDAVNRRRVTKDALDPTNKARDKYWIVDDENIKIQHIQQLEYQLQGAMAMAQEDAAAMCESGGFFAEGQIGIQGLDFTASSGEISRLGSALQDRSDVAPDLAKGKGKNNKVAAKPAVPKALPLSLPSLQLGKGAGHVTDPPAPVEPGKDLQPMVKAEMYKRKLSKAMGECVTVIMELEELDASDTLVKQLQSANAALIGQAKAIGSLIAREVNTDHEYEPYLAKAQEILTYFNNKRQMSNAFIGVAKRQAKAVADAAEAAQKAATDAEGCEG